MQVMIRAWAMWGGFCTIDGELLISLGGKSGLFTVNGPCTSNKIAYLYGDALGFNVLHLQVEGHEPQTMCTLTEGGSPYWGGRGRAYQAAGSSKRLTYRVIRPERRLQL